MQGVEVRAASSRNSTRGISIAFEACTNFKTREQGSSILEVNFESHLVKDSDYCRSYKNQYPDLFCLFFWIVELQMRIT